MGSFAARLATTMLALPSARTRTCTAPELSYLVRGVVWSGFGGILEPVLCVLCRQKNSGLLSQSEADCSRTIGPVVVPNSFIRSRLLLLHACALFSAAFRRRCAQKPTLAVQSMAKAQGPKSQNTIKDLRKAAGAKPQQGPVVVKHSRPSARARVIAARREKAAREGRAAPAAAPAPAPPALSPLGAAPLSAPALSPLAPVPRSAPLAPAPAPLNPLVPDTIGPWTLVPDRSPPVT